MSAVKSGHGWDIFRSPIVSGLIEHHFSSGRLYPPLPTLEPAKDGHGFLALVVCQRGGYALNTPVLNVWSTVALRPCRADRPLLFFALKTKRLEKREERQMTLIGRNRQSRTERPLQIYR